MRTFGIGAWVMFVGCTPKFPGHDDLPCGDGTHAENGECVADDTEVDRHADADADSDADADADSDTDTDTDTDADSDADADTGLDTGGPPIIPDPEAMPPDGPGPFSVGTFASSFTGSWGIDLPVQVWYPSLESDGPLHHYGSILYEEGLEDVEPACAEKRPVLLYSHGHHSTAWWSAYFAEHLASHGWVVAAPEHTANTYYAYDDSRVGEIAFRRPVDISDTADWLYASADGEASGLDACLDPEAGYALSGHSFGGYTTIATSGALFDADSSAMFCGWAPTYWLCDLVADWVDEHPEYESWDPTDERVWAAIPMAPAGYEVLYGGLDSIEVPSLYLGGGLDFVTSMAYSVELLYNDTGSDQKYLGELIEGNHSTFISLCDLWPELDDCGPAYIDESVGQQEIKTVSLAFLRMILGEEGMEEYFPVSSPLWNWTEGDG